MVTGPEFFLAHNGDHHLQGGLPDMTSTRRRTARRASIPVTVLLASTLLFSVLGTGAAEASATTCTKPAGAFAAFHASFSNGSMKLGSATGSGLAADACGSISAVGGKLVATVLPSDMSFAPVSVKVLFLSLPANIVVNAPVTGPAGISKDLKSADISLTASITASASLLGFKCDIGPIAPTLTTGKSGSLTGKTFTASGGVYSGTVVANDFAVPGIKKSRACPGLVAFLANTLVGLPAAPGKASIQMDGTIKLG